MGLQNFKFGPTTIQAQKARVSNLLLLVYKGNPKHVFSGFLEREECASFVYRVLYPKSFLISSTGVIPWKISRSGVVEVTAFSCYQRCWWSKPLRVVLESQTGEFMLLNFWVESQSHKCGCLCCKGLIEKEFMDSELAYGCVSKFYMW